MLENSAIEARAISPKVEDGDVAPCHEFSLALIIQKTTRISCWLFVGCYAMPLAEHLIPFLN